MAIVTMPGFLISRLIPPGAVIILSVAILTCVITVVFPMHSFVEAGHSRLDVVIPIIAILKSAVGVAADALQFTKKLVGTRTIVSPVVETVLDALNRVTVLLVKSGIAAATRIPVVALPISAILTRVLSVCRSSGDECGSCRDNHE